MVLSDFLLICFYRSSHSFLVGASSSEARILAVTFFFQSTRTDQNSSSKVLRNIMVSN